MLPLPFDTSVCGLLVPVCINKKRTSIMLSIGFLSGFGYTFFVLEKSLFSKFYYGFDLYHFGQYHHRKDINFRNPHMVLYNWKLLKSCNEVLHVFRLFFFFKEGIICTMHV